MSTGSVPCEQSDPDTAALVRPWVDGHVDAVLPGGAAPAGPALHFGFDSEGRRMTVRGDIDFANSAALVDAMTALLDRDLGTIIVDIRHLKVADAASLTLFLASCKALRDGGVQLRIVGATRTARRAGRAAGLDALLADE